MRTSIGRERSRKHHFLLSVHGIKAYAKREGLDSMTQMSERIIDQLTRVQTLLDRNDVLSAARHLDSVQAALDELEMQLTSILTGTMGEMGYEERI